VKNIERNNYYFEDREKRDDFDLMPLCLYFFLFFTLTFILTNGKRVPTDFNLLKTAGYVMDQQFNIQQFYVLPTLYLCVLYLSENRQRLVPLIS
jgi:hypothetical protein